MKSVYEDNPPNRKSKIKIGYGSANKARKSIKALKKQPKQYQTLMAYTMYHRAKYHKHQTKDMKNAMKIYKKFINTLKNKREY
jgi:hypothetical protein